MDNEAATAKRQRMEAKCKSAAALMEELAEAEAAVRRLRKAAKRAAAQAAVEAEREVVVGATANAAKEQVKVDPANEKRSRQAAKYAAADAAADVVKEESEVDPAEAKRLRKAAKRALAEVATSDAAGAEVEVDPSEAKRLRKAAKRAAAEAAAAAAEDKSEIDVAKAKVLRKAAMKAAASTAEIMQEHETHATRPNAQVIVEKHVSKKASSALIVFVGCIPFKCEEATLWKDFSECGEIQELKMPLDADGRPGGFAFITFKTREGAVEALKYNGEDYGGRKLTVKIDGKVFVKGIPNSVQDSEVQDFFKACGEIQTLKVPRWPDGGAKGMAFINFKTTEGLERVLELDGKLWGTMRLSVEKAAQSQAGQGKGKGKGKMK